MFLLLLLLTPFLHSFSFLTISLIFILSLLLFLPFQIPLTVFSQLHISLCFLPSFFTFLSIPHYFLSPSSPSIFSFHSFLIVFLCFIYFFSPSNLQFYHSFPLYFPTAVSFWPCFQHPFFYLILLSSSSFASSLSSSSSSLFITLLGHTQTQAIKHPIPTPRYSLTPSHPHCYTYPVPPIRLPASLLTPASLLRPCHPPASPPACPPAFTPTTFYLLSPLRLP